MKIIVESGATKSDWRVFDSEGNQVKRLLLPGMNVSSMNTEEVCGILSEGLASIDDGPVEAFYMYTAGVVTDEVRERLAASVTGRTHCPKVDIQNDLVGAARSLFGTGSGIAAIMGTGSNTCFFDGKSVSQKVYSGGFIIGDEGSASALGKMFLTDFLKNRIPDDVADAFRKEFDASYEGIVAGVYKSPSPAKYLGGLAPFIVSHYDHPVIKALVDRNFENFINRSLLAYDTAVYPVGVVGGFGFACRDIFLPLCEKAGLRIATFSPEPINGLIKLHIAADSPRL